MLIKSLEFVRMVDAQPTDEKVRNRKQTAQALQAPLKASRETLLDIVQGIVVGFGRAPLLQDSPSVVLLIKALQDVDTTVPHDLKENAVELRATAALAVGELLLSFVGKHVDSGANCAALALASAYAVRPHESEQHSRFVLEALSGVSNDLIQSAAHLRRRRSSGALKELEGLKEATATTDLWATVMPSVKSAVSEIEANAVMDREELETLWWMFGGYSNIVKTPLAQLSPGEAAFCSAIELAQRVLLPPPVTALEMVNRAVEAGRKSSALGPLSIQDAAKKWSRTMIASLAPADAKSNETIHRYPALLPISWACRRMLDAGEGAHDLGREFEAATGIAPTQVLNPTKLGAQVFSETCLQRMLGLA